MTTQGEAAVYEGDSLQRFKDELNAGKRGTLTVTLEGECVGLKPLGVLCSSTAAILRDVERNVTGKRPVVYWAVEAVSMVRREGGVVFQMTIGPRSKPRKRKRAN